ncbi:telokin-like protein-20 [Anticarsia gemmatalis multiple nucleopolyhedrovirus]|uniref:Telokin-like protein-20 n=1 Tax=Anticarsia gemmatalis multiple nucleopolyhedrovirus TaxID=268591 RepID=A0A0S3IWS1_9ABAC|nr:telokin-like protein-20 [Anticarsia gemmatalis multiple nucleopolyhedrovirus]YP_803475.1 telokin-like protein-20 [Anticarsia gemmatalis nucleopolyhedrovirus]ABI13864.1 telokin-like protein-20 [Anticarsia gemmatalis multiple nucleopolyhedrovirus]ALR69886.1 telokin-like protein-20 [Anticarsia gemmatalis multiple nucleopolyhedrovirus]ALR70044.1 telokin-like protein-20 [Anticarsia gemmatalis multiple nucleopolyhedrovirus]ALR70201.1 telokin-like protein-20 [Anticarsia gemmatalis multiple nucleop
MASTNSTTSDIVVRARVVPASDGETVLEFGAENEHRLMKGAHDVRIMPSDELEALHDSPHTVITCGEYTVEFNLSSRDRREAQALLSVKRDDVLVSGGVFRLKLWNNKKLADTPVPHHGPAEEENVVAERFGSESGDAPSSPKKQKLDESEQD